MEMLQAAYPWVASVIFLLLSLVWKREDFLNLAIKAVLFLMVFAGALLCAAQVL